MLGLGKYMNGSAIVVDLVGHYFKYHDCGGSIISRSWGEGETLYSGNHGPKAHLTKQNCSSI